MLIKVRKRGDHGEPRISYKLFVTICVSILVGVFMMLMLINTYLVMRSNSLEMSEQEAVLTTQHMVTGIDENLENVRQYYLYCALDDEIEWFINNRLAFSDYQRYQKINTALGNNALFPNCVNNYVILNINNNRVISSRGIYNLTDMVNAEEILGFYERNSLETNRGNWVYVADGTDVATTDSLFHLTVDTDGLNFVLNLPLGVTSTKGMLFVNINQEELNQWIWDGLSVSGKYAAVFDTDGSVIYSSNDEFASSCAELMKSSGTNLPVKTEVNGTDCIISASTSTTLGWTYYVAYDYGRFLGATSKLLIEFLIAIIALSVLSFISVRYALYQPVDRLIKEVTEEEKPEVSGNELQFLAGQFANLKNDREALHQAMLQRRDKLAELFEMRLIRSAVSAEDEWEEYVKVLGLTEHQLYAAVAIILNLRDEEAAEDELNEDAICLSLAENQPDALKQKPWLPLIYDSCTLTCIFADETEEALMDQISSYFEEMKAYALNSYGYHIQMGVSELHTQHRHLGRAYHECVYALTMDAEAAERDHDDAKPLLGRDCRFYLQTTQASTDGINLKKYEKEICDGLKAMDKGQCYRLLDDFTDQLRTVGEWTVASIYFAALIDTILMEAINMQIDILVLCPEGMQKLYQHVMEAGDVSRVRKNMKKMLIDPILQERSNLLVDHSYQMMTAIEKKLADSKGNITLNECADELNVTPTYIWKIMKAESGKTFSEYQEEYKIEEAKKLLQTNMSVSDIASELGYTNAQNFIRFFSKGTGLTPGKYRKLMYGSL